MVIGLFHPFTVGNLKNRFSFMLSASICSESIRLKIFKYNLSLAIKTTERIPRKDERDVLRQLFDINLGPFYRQYNSRKYLHCVRCHLSEIICKYLFLVSGEKGIVKFC